ncbi:MAG: hypothetical protein U0W24_06630 [Bacteroidales bacterium]
MHSSIAFDIWAEIFTRSGGNARLMEKYWEELKKAYSARGRYYHNLDHIGRMLESYLKFNNQLKDPVNVAFAIFFHDVVYSAKRKDNEEKSAVYAENILKQLNFNISGINKCKDYILATKTHINIKKDSDLDFFLDFDLEILGSGWDSYSSYIDKIRKEYRIYPDLVYIPGRKKVLTHFLKLERIYKSEIYIELFEKQARENLEKELKMLSGV